MDPTAGLTERRKRLFELFKDPAVLLHNGFQRPRNFAANSYRFRGSSHFIFFCGICPPGAVLLLTADSSRLFLDSPSADVAIWEGASGVPGEFEKSVGVDGVFFRNDLKGAVDQIGLKNLRALPALDLHASREIESLLGRKPDIGGIDRTLAIAVVQLRLKADGLGLYELKQAIAATTAGQLAAVRMVRPGVTDWDIQATVEFEFSKRGLEPAFPSIVTLHGEVLHNRAGGDVSRAGDLVLVDCGAESRGGYSGDLTRTYPVSGKFSPSQRAIYDLVLAAHQKAVTLIKPGIDYLDVHLAASHVLAQGLVDLKILRGNASDIVERGAHAIFFPHGVGHLLGLDVHDMEDLGDLAQYGPGKERSTQFGLSYLRLNRKLEAGMVVTVEPGYYRIPALLENPARLRPFKDTVNLTELEKFTDVRGIRIEDDVVVTPDGCEVLSRDVPNSADDIEKLIAS